MQTPAAQTLLAAVIALLIVPLPAAQAATNLPADQPTAVITVTADQPEGQTPSPSEVTAGPSPATPPSPNVLQTPAAGYAKAAIGALMMTLIASGIIILTLLANNHHHDPLSRLSPRSKPDGRLPKGVV